MATASTPSPTRNREILYIQTGENRFFGINVVKSNFNGIDTMIGGKWTLDANDSASTGSREEALANGVLFFRLEYLRNNKKQTAIIPVAPSKVDDVFARNAFQGKKYGAHTITKIRPIRRQRLTAF